ncbi:hypothetical protein ACFLYK_01140 [Candidatus Cloacimonadota bacterium]
MITVFIDKKLKKFQEEIRYTFNFIFHTAGFEYKYIQDLSEADPSDIIFVYGLIPPIESDIEDLAHDRAMFFIPSEPDLLQPGTMDRDTIEKRITEANYFKDIPLITEREFEAPIVYFKNENLFFGSYNFDLIGNVFFHLVNYEFSSISTRNKDHLLPDSVSCFTDFSKKPFINAFIWLLNEAIKDCVKVRPNSFLLKKCCWPEDQPYAAAVSHNIDSLKKWTLSSLIKSAFQDLLLFYNVSHFFKNGIRRLKYIITNIEEYWNFDLISDIENEYNVKSTYFWGSGTEHKDEFDYSLQDQDIISELNHQSGAGNEIALLGSINSYKEDLLAEQKQKLITLLNTDKLGVRQNRLRYDPDITTEYHSKYAFQYDSTRAFTDRNGFKNGIGYPFYNLADSPIGEERHFALFKTHNCLEIPLIYSDDHLRLSEIKNISFEQARDEMASLTRVLKFYNGLITFDFSVKNFAEIPYNKNLYQETLDQLKEDNAYHNTYLGIADWWVLRDSVVIRDSRNEVMVYFPNSCEKFSLELLGLYQIENVVGCEIEISGNKILFSNVKADSSIKIKLVKVEE